MNITCISSLVHLDIKETDTLREPNLRLQLFYYGLVEDARFASILV